MPQSFVVSPGWLADNLENESVRIIDTRKPDDFLKGHIANAASLPISELLNNEDSETTARLAGSLDIDQGKLVVTYDDHRGIYAARVAWSLERIGHPAVALLETPFEKWRTLGLPISKEAPSFAASEYNSGERSQLVADSEYVRSKLRDGDSVLVDTRERLGYLDGHIPGAKTMPWRIFGGQDAVLQSAENLRRLIAEHGIRVGPEVITYCDVGVTAALAFYAFKAAGFERVRLYPGSFMEWQTLGLSAERVELAYYRDLL